MIHPYEGNMLIETSSMPTGLSDREGIITDTAAGAQESVKTKHHATLYDSSIPVYISRIVALPEINAETLERSE